MKTKTKLIILAIVALAGFIGVRIHQAGRMAEYAKNNNCNWVQTGTLYGDDRDWTCKERK